jgi:hypothetical protein
MVILHTFLALAAGFAAMTILLLGFAALLARVIPAWAGEPARPGFGCATVNFGGAFLTASVGGYITAWVAAANPLIHVLALALVVLALAALSALQARGKQPIWYQLALVALPSLGVLAGGLLRLRVLDIL